MRKQFLKPGQQKWVKVYPIENICARNVEVLDLDNPRENISVIRSMQDGTLGEIPCLIKNVSDRTIWLKKETILTRINAVHLRASSSMFIGHKQAVVNTCDVSSKGKDEIYTKSIKGTCLINCKRREQDKYAEWSKENVFLGQKVDNWYKTR